MFGKEEENKFVQQNSLIKTSKKKTVIMRTTFVQDKGLKRVIAN